MQNSKISEYHAYTLVRSQNGVTYATGEYCKYFPAAPYIALFKEYPSDHTTVTLCRRIPDNCNEYGYRRVHLISKGIGGESQVVGHFVIVCTVTNEQEATLQMQHHMKSTEIISSAMKTLEDSV